MERKIQLILAFFQELRNLVKFWASIDPKFLQSVIKGYQRRGQAVEF